MKYKAKLTSNMTGVGIALFTSLMASSFAATAHTDENLSNTVADNKVAAVNQAEDSFLKKLVVGSDLIFKGELIDINEALSIENIPYTFVTYRVGEVISGRYFNDTITLKYVGGQFANGNRLSASNSPTVKVGENAILMVQQSVDTGCDFVDCENGRFILQNGQVIAANESAIAIDEKGKVNYKTLSERGANFGAGVQKTKSNIPAFIAHIKQLDKASSLQRNKVRAVAIDIDRHAPFKAYSVLTKAGQAPQVAGDDVKGGGKNKPQAFKGSQFDQWEAEQLRLNGGNPLLSSSDSNANTER